MKEERTDTERGSATRAWDSRFTKLEQRLAEIADSNEERVLALRDAVSEFSATELATRDRDAGSIPPAPGPAAPPSAPAARDYQATRHRRPPCQASGVARRGGRWRAAQTCRPENS